MLNIYRAANIVDAHLIRQMLEAKGIPAFIQGEYLQGAVGELPANTEILVQVANASADAARAVVEEWERAEPVVPEDDVSEENTPRMTSQRSRGGYSLAKGVVLFLIVVIGGAVAMSLLFRYPQG